MDSLRKITGGSSYATRIASLLSWPGSLLAWSGNQVALMFCCAALFFGVCPCEAVELPRIAVVVGPSNHPPGTHEVQAGGELMAKCLNQTGLVEATVYSSWPDSQVLNNATSVVFIGDIFPPQKIPQKQEALAQLTEMMARGGGIVCVHYATGLRAEDVAADGEHPLLHWMGGYFATRCKHHQSIARIFEKATIEPTIGEHPVLRGWKTFTVHDEPYINNYFGPDQNKPAAGVRILATSQLPPEAPKAEPVAWCIERADHGRGFGIVMPHFYRNWEDNDLRCFILNGIVWSAKVEVPAAGVQVSLSDVGLSVR